MTLTNGSNSANSLKTMFNVEKKENDIMIALVGNPNTGKSTVFNYLTGLRQHTGNWPGKTVSTARGSFKYENQDYVLIDLPGTYSIFALTQEELIARDFVCFGNPDSVIVVTDATCLERNFNILFQITELTDNVILCINLVDEARKKGISIDKDVIEKELNIPVALTSARSGDGINELLKSIGKIPNNDFFRKDNTIEYSDKIENLIDEFSSRVKKIVPNINPRWLSLRIIAQDESIIDSMSHYLNEDQVSTIKNLMKDASKEIDKEDITDELSKTTYDYAKKIVKKSISYSNSEYMDKDEKIDKIITSKVFGLPIMLLLLGCVLWITIQGANYPSDMLSKALFSFEPYLKSFCALLHLPIWLNSLLTEGVYRSLAWVVSVMLPPMAIFFPIFTLLEDLGYLPRIAFNLDHLFKKACAHGKQCLTMCMGFGCNAAGIIGCRIIESPREKLIAILTNNFVPCNGRFPPPYKGKQNCSSALTMKKQPN